MVPLVLLVLHAGVTFALTGIIWFVHQIHYPIIQVIGAQQAAIFEALHWRKTIRIASFMLTIELISGLAILVWAPPGVPTFLIVTGNVLIVVIWATTWGICVPKHCQLKATGSAAAATILMKANAFRAALWTVRTILVASMLLYALNALSR